MVKSELIQKISAKADIPPKIAVNTIFNSITEALIHGDGIEIRGFGSFKVREYKGRNSNYPLTGSDIQIPLK